MKQAFLSLLLLAAGTSFAQNKEQSIGCWTMPSIPGESLQLNRDGSFLFYDYNKGIQQLDRLYGTWSFSGKTITLMYEDRPQQRFTLVKDKKGKWLLTKAGGFRFRKAAPEECRQE